jgi:hypothetical protein
MPDNTLEATADSLSSAAQAAFTQFGAAIRGSGVDAATDWQAVEVAASVLDKLGRDTADGIRNIQENATLPEFEKRVRINELNELHANMSRLANRDLEASVAKVESSLLEAQRVIPESDPFGQMMVRNEIDQLVAAYPHSPEKPGKPMLVILQEIAQQSPRYAAEIAGQYGKVKLTASGEAQFAQDLFKNVVTLASADTPKAQAAKNALNVMTQLKVKGHMPGISIASRYRVEAANQPAKPAGRPAWTPDTIIPRR